MNKDFYNDLPGMVCIILDELIEKYSKEEWLKINYKLLNILKGETHIDTK